jgi:hypothetical protein
MIRIGLLSLFLDLVAGTRASSCPYRPTYDRAGRACHRATHRGTPEGSCGTTGAGPRLIVPLGRLTGNGTASGARGSADCSTDRTADHTADDRAAHRPGGSTDGLAGVLLVLGRRALRVDALIQSGSLILAPGVVHVCSPHNSSLRRGRAGVAVSQSACQS